MEMRIVLVDAVNTLIIKDRGVFKEMQDLLDSYPNRKIVVTNADADQIKQFGIDKLPYEFFSLQRNPEKANPEFFEKLLAHYGISAPDVVYFEHNQQAVASAEAIGINAYLYDPESKDLAALRRFLDKNLAA